MPKADDILTKALTATKVGKLKWDPVGRYSFRTQVGTLFLTISRENDNAFVNFIFEIFDSNGNVLESSAGYQNDSQGTLYELARRTALNIDDALKNLDQQLEDLI
jgi:hypothetical protein